MLMLFFFAVSNECMVGFCAVREILRGVAPLHCSLCIFLVAYIYAIWLHQVSKHQVLIKIFRILFTICTVLEYISGLISTAMLQTCLLELLTDGLLQRCTATVATS